MEVQVLSAAFQIRLPSRFDGLQFNSWTGQVDNEIPSMFRVQLKQSLANRRGARWGVIVALALVGAFHLLNFWKGNRGISDLISNVPRSENWQIGSVHLMGSIIAFLLVLLMTTLPFILVGAFFGALLGGSTTQQKLNLARDGQCISCGYDLRASGDVCPECGKSQCELFDRL